MSHILIATDLSAPAMHAARYAFELFGPLNSYVMLHAYVEDIMMLGKNDEDEKAAKEGLQAHAERFIQATGLESVQRQVHIGQVASVLEEVVPKRAIDLVVVGNRGKSGATFFFGSNTAQVVKGSGVPVLAVPEHAAIERPKRILLATDLGEVGARTLDVLRHIAKLSNAEVLVGHVRAWESPRPQAQELRIFEQALRDVAHRYQQVQATDLLEGLEWMVKREKVDLLAVVHRHAGFLGGLLHPSASKAIAERINLPMLVMQDKAL
ncbi:MAG TPA: universal stress protein [Flavobacteriales bacterium]|nr:universal stress protein [Flavobacteriales bacterium]